MNERRESIDENEKNNNYGNDCTPTQKKMASPQHKRNASGRNDNAHAPPKSLTAQSVAYLDGQRKPTLLPPKSNITEQKDHDIGIMSLQQKAKIEAKESEERQIAIRNRKGTHIRPGTATQPDKSQLLHEVEKQTRKQFNYGKRSFIEENKDQFKNVSKINMTRAEQVRIQFAE